MAASSLLSSISISHTSSTNTSQTLGFVNPTIISQQKPQYHQSSFPGNLRTSAKKRSRALVVHATPEVAGDFLSGFLPFLPSSEDNSWLAWATGLCVAIPLITARLLTLSSEDRLLFRKNIVFFNFLEFCDGCLILELVRSGTEQVEAAAETVEKVADVVGNVAHEVDKAAEGFKENLPAGKLKDIVEAIEHVAEETAKDAQIVEDLMDKVEELDDKLEEFLHHGSNQPAAKTSPVEEKKP
ncbi:PREDICTED: uncharacterized protein LOC109169710 isoform X1 [Ipomoea nil]|uniref:uncharacterized protein LOC109169710 isoform X1 n=1 Tax=Ipomoea nil TaxID=35883 RepID=UPI000900E716|nr:PREDICTED: uncharacterized protein LOC109169710 isoform X1 [Ipomoea nil]